MLKLATTLCLLSGSLAAQWPKPPGKTIYTNR